MIIPLTSTVIMHGTSAADSNACIGTALPINLSHRRHRPFQPWTLTQSRRTSPERRPCEQANGLPLARPTPGTSSNANDHLPLSPECSNSRGFVQSGFYEVALTPAFRAPLCPPTSQNPQDSQITCKVIQGGKRRVVCHGDCDSGADGL